MPVHCTACGSQLGPAGLPKRLRLTSVGSGQLSLQEREDLLEAAQTIENLRMGPAVAKPEKWTTERTRYRNSQPHIGPFYRCVTGPNICTHCGYEEHEAGCVRA